jgi:hypothetical protein
LRSTRTSGKCGWRPVIPILAFRYGLLRSRSAEREANELLTAIRKEAEGKITERPTAVRVSACRMDETVEARSIAVERAVDCEPMVTERVNDDQEVRSSEDTDLVNAERDISDLSRKDEETGHWRHWTI